MSGRAALRVLATGAVAALAATGGIAVAGALDDPPELDEDTENADTSTPPLSEDAPQIAPPVDVPPSDPPHDVPGAKIDDEDSGDGGDDDADDDSSEVDGDSERAAGEHPHGGPPGHHNSHGRGHVMFDEGTHPGEAKGHAKHHVSAQG